MAAVHRHWLTIYCTLELELDFPILEALTAYWRWVTIALAEYRRTPRKFPWNRYDDPGVIFTIMCQDYNAVFHAHQNNLFEKYPEVVRAIVARTGYAIGYVTHQTRELCLLAVNHWGYALRYVQPALKERYPEIVAAAIRQEPLLTFAVPAQLLVAAVAKSSEAWFLTDTPLLL